MSDAFISYRRKPSEEFANLLQEKLKNKKIDAFIDTQRLEKGEFSPQLVNAIKNSPNFICLLADGTLDSEWVRKEIQLAYEQGKHFVPVFLHHQGYQYDKVVPYIKTYPAIEKLLSFQGVDVHNVGDINYYAHRIAKLLVLKRPYWQLTLIGMPVLLLILFLVILINPFNINNSPSLDPTNTPKSVALVTDELSPMPSETVTMQLSDTPTDTATTQPTDISTITLTVSDTPTETPNYNATLDVLATQTAVARPTNTSTSTPTNTPTATNTSTNVISFDQTLSSANILSFTPTVTSTLNPECIYTVIAGDTVFRIAQKINTTMAEFRAVNPAIANTDILRVGQQLIIPNCEDTSNYITNQTTATPGSGISVIDPAHDINNQEYVVQAGDTLSRIATRFNTTVQAIVNANNLTSPNQLSVGQRLIIPSITEEP